MTSQERSKLMKEKWKNPEYREHMSEAHKWITEEKHPNWKGEDVGYVPLHIWVRKHLGKPSKCEHCQSTDKKRYEWANLSGKYKRNLYDWIRLCRGCHIINDKAKGFWGHSKGNENRRVIIL